MSFHKEYINTAAAAATSAAEIQSNKQAAISTILANTDLVILIWNLEPGLHFHSVWLGNWNISGQDAAAAAATTVAAVLRGPWYMETVYQASIP